jgi:hypothetical protein
VKVESLVWHIDENFNEYSQEYSEETMMRHRRVHGYEHDECQ